MTSTRIKVSFAEDFSSRANIRTKYLVLVPRNECPDVGTLKEYIRNRFEIPQDRQLKLNINGFSLPNWEITEVIREDDMLCVHSAAYVTSPTSQEISPASERRKRKVTKDDEEFVAKRTKKDHDHLQRDKKNGIKEQRGGSSSFDNLNEDVTPDIPVRESNPGSIAQQRKEHKRQRKDCDPKNAKKNGMEKQRDEFSSADMSETTVPSISERLTDPGFVSKEKKEHKRKKKDRDPREAEKSRRNQQGDGDCAYSNGGSLACNIPTSCESSGDSLARSRSKVKKSHQKVAPEALSSHPVVVPQVTVQATENVEKPQKCRKKKRDENNEMAHSSPEFETQMPSISCIDQDVAHDDSLTLPPHLTNGRSGLNTVNQSEVNLVTKIAANSQSEEGIEKSSPSEIKLNNSNESAVESKAGVQSELVAEEESNKDTKKKRKRRRKKKNKSTVLSLQGDPEKASPGVPATHYGAGEPLRVKDCVQQNQSQTGSLHIADKRNGQRIEKPGTGDRMDGLSLLGNGGQSHVKFGSDDEVDHSIATEAQNKQDGSVTGSSEHGVPKKDDLTGRTSDHHLGEAERPTEDRLCMETVIEQPAKDYGTYPPLNGPPRDGDIIAFKVLELSSLYCPEISEYKEGVVTKYDHRTQMVEIQLTCLKSRTPATKQEEEAEGEEGNYGRFEMELEEGWTTECQQQLESSLMSIPFPSMIEPKLLS